MGHQESKIREFIIEIFVAIAVRTEPKRTMAIRRNNFLPVSCKKLGAKVI